MNDSAISTPQEEARLAPSPRVGVVLLNWNQYEDTAVCIRSLNRSVYQPASILVFDNGSVDGSGKQIQAEFPNVQVVFSAKNLGFAEGNNQAIRELLKQEIDYIWVLNNDTDVLPDCLGALVNAMEKDSSIGASTAKIWNMNTDRIIWAAGSSFNHWTFNTKFWGGGEADVGQYDGLHDMDILSGCCMLIRTEVARKIGMFTQDFFIYAEDIDWGVRAMENGVRMVCVPEAVLWHKMYGSAVKGKRTGRPKSTPRLEYLLTRNRFLLVRLHTRPFSIRRLFALTYHIVFRSLPRAVALLLLPGRRAAGWALFRGLWHGIRFYPTSSTIASQNVNKAPDYNSGD